MNQREVLGMLARLDYRLPVRDPGEILIFCELRYTHGERRVLSQGARDCVVLNFKTNQIDAT